MRRRAPPRRPSGAPSQSYARGRLRARVVRLLRPDVRRRFAIRAGRGGGGQAAQVVCLFCDMGVRGDRVVLVLLTCHNKPSRSRLPPVRVETSATMRKLLLRICCRVFEGRQNTQASRAATISLWRVYKHLAHNAHNVYLDMFCTCTRLERGCRGSGGSILRSRNTPSPPRR